MLNFVIAMYRHTQDIVHTIKHTRIIALIEMKSIIDPHTNEEIIVPVVIASDNSDTPRVNSFLDMVLLAKVIIHGLIKLNGIEWNICET